MRRRLLPLIVTLLLAIATFAALPMRALADPAGPAAEEAAEQADAVKEDQLDEAFGEGDGDGDAPEGPKGLAPTTIDEGDIAVGEVGPIRHEAPSASTAANYEANARGFYAWLGDDYANAVFTRTTVDDIDGTAFVSYTKMGASDDATSLENMRAALAYIPDGNRLRTTDDLFPGRSPLKISSGAMAVSQLHANWSRHYFGHASQHGDVRMYAENVAWNWGYTNPYTQWYDEEKPIYIETKVWSGDTGHYLNIVDFQDSFCGTGFAISRGGKYGYPYTYVQNFSGYWYSDRLWDYDEYLSLFNTFYDAHDISKATVTFATQTYDGTAKTPVPTVKLGSKTLVNGTDYTLSGYKNNVNAGTASVTINAKGANFFGSKTATFTINRVPITQAKVAAIGNQTYVAGGVKPNPTITFNGTTLKSGTDYTLSYKNNEKVGTATVSIAGKGNFSGTTSKTFTIVKASIAKAKVTIPDQEWTGKPLYPDPTVMLGNVRLVQPAEYRVEYVNNVDEGTATFTVIGLGNYTGRVTGMFRIASGIPVYRLYNRKTSEHLYTINYGEFRDLPQITKGDWVQEGIAWYAPKKSNTPVYRLYNKKSGDHHYTTSKQEADTLVKRHGWTLETTAFYSDDAKRVPLYRLYNGRLKRGQHHYTADANERDVLTSKHGWKDEAIGFYGARR